jgi:anti-sigma regulatory factor (Ser/Thr protein kinase)
VAEIELEIPPRSDYLALVRQVVAAAVSIDPPFRDRRMDDLQLAVTEACANAIEANTARGSTEPIVITCRSEPDRVEIEIVDRAGGFDPVDVGSLPSATDPARLEHERGLGIPLMRELTDDVSFESSADGTSVRLTIVRPSG